MGVAVRVESWWNGVWGHMGSVRVWLLRDGDEWQVRRAGPWGRESLWPERTEDEARQLLGQLVAGDGWRRLDHLNRPRSAPDADDGVDRPLGG